ncbi:hypothetical protein GCM10027262_63920 [Nocardia tengchongensis]
MHHDGQHMFRFLGIGDPEQPGPHRYPGAHVEALGHEFGDRRDQLAVRDRGQRGFRVNVVDGFDHLDQHPVVIRVPRSQ